MNYEQKILEIAEAIYDLDPAFDSDQGKICFCDLDARGYEHVRRKCEASAKAALACIIKPIETVPRDGRTDAIAWSSEIKQWVDVWAQDIAEDKESWEVTTHWADLPKMEASEP